MGDDRSIAYRESNLSIYRASGIGSCVRAITAAMLGYGESRGQWQETILSDAAREGNLHEGAVVDELILAGHRIEATQPTVELKVLPRAIVRGHIDGLGRPPKARKDRVYEIKSMSKTRFQKWTAHKDFTTALLSPEFHRYGFQISAYMEAVGLPAVYVVKNRDSGKTIIEELTHPPVSMKEIRKKVIEVEKWRVRGELPPCDVDAGEKFFCPFPALHDDVLGDEDDDEFDPIDDVTKTIVAGICENWAELTTTIRAGERANEERREVNKRLIEAMGGDNPGYEMKAGPWTVKQVGGKTKATVNWKGFYATLLTDGLPETFEEFEVVRDKHSTQRGYVYPKVSKGEK